MLVRDHPECIFHHECGPNVRNYEDIEQFEVRSFFDLFRPRRTRAVWANEVRKAVNRIHLSDEELLIVAGNRIRAAEAAGASARSRLSSAFKLRGMEREEWLDVSGQELQALMRLAGVGQDEPVVAHHPYRVRYRFYRHLFTAATR